MQNAQHQNRKSIYIMLNIIVHSRLSSQSVVNSRQNKTGTNRKPDYYLFHWFWLGCFHYKNLKSTRGTQRVKIYILVDTHWQGTYWDGHISFFLLYLIYRSMCHVRHAAAHFLTFKKSVPRSERNPHICLVFRWVFSSSLFDELCAHVCCSEICKLILLLARSQSWVASWMGPERWLMLISDMLEGLLERLISMSARYFFICQVTSRTLVNFKKIIIIITEFCHLVVCNVATISLTFSMQADGLMWSEIYFYFNCCGVSYVYFYILYILPFLSNIYVLIQYTILRIVYSLKMFCRFD